MTTIKLVANIDENHRLSAEVPSHIASGPIEVLVLVPSPEEDETGHEWMSGVAREWESELSDPREDLYSLTDGEPVDASG